MFNQKVSIILILFLALLLTSCGADKEVEIEDAIDKANICLSTSDCECAVEALELLGRQNQNASYMKTLASAYACRTGYTTTNFFSNDLSLIDANNLIGSMTTFSTSASMDAPDNEDYLNLQTAIDILLYAGGLSTSQNTTATKRLAKFSAGDAGDINSQVLFMIMAQLGKYFSYYGNASNGIKGTGANTNQCLAAYDDISGISYAFLVSESPGTCNAGGLVGHPDIGTIASGLNIERMCQGVVLFNNFLDVFPNIIASIGGTDFDALEGIEAVIDAAKLILTTAHPTASDVLEVTSQTKCEADNAGDDTNLQIYFIYILELLFL